MRCPPKELRKTVARQLSDSLTNRKKAVRHPQNCLAIIKRRARIQKDAEEHYTMVVRLAFAVRNKLYNSQCKTKFIHFPQRWQPHHKN